MEYAYVYLTGYISHVWRMHQKRGKHTHVYTYVPGIYAYMRIYVTHICHAILKAQIALEILTLVSVGGNSNLHR